MPLNWGDGSAVKNVVGGTEAPSMDSVVGRDRCVLQLSTLKLKKVGGQVLYFCNLAS